MKLNAKFDDQTTSVTHFTSIQNYCELYRMNRVLGGILVTKMVEGGNFVILIV